MSNDRGTTADVVRRSDTECHELAEAYLAELIGAEPDDVVWDERHHLQGHAQLGDHELVLIAARDDAHQPVVLTAETWDEVRRATGAERCELIRAYAIEDHEHLITALDEH